MQNAIEKLKYTSLFLNHAQGAQHNYKTKRLKICYERSYAHLPDCQPRTQAHFTDVVMTWVRGWPDRMYYVIILCT